VIAAPVNVELAISYVRQYGLSLPVAQRRLDVIEESRPATEDVSQLVETMNRCQSQLRAADAHRIVDDAAHGSACRRPEKDRLWARRPMPESIGSRGLLQMSNMSLWIRL
jgi:hypothetical protein